MASNMRYHLWCATLAWYEQAHSAQQKVSARMGELMLNLVPIDFSGNAPAPIGAEAIFIFTLLLPFLPLFRLTAHFQSWGFTILPRIL